MVPAAAVIPSLTAFSYAVAVETLVASARRRATVRKAERSRQVRCTGQRRTASLSLVSRVGGRDRGRRGAGGIRRGRVK